MPIINWTLNQHLPLVPIRGSFADLRFLSQPPKTLQDRLKLAIEHFPCDVLFVHRDGEATKDNDLVLQKRNQEIADAVPDRTPYVSIIPIKMMETWLLTDKNAILKAAGNPRSTVDINLPPIKKLETCATPKEDLYGLLISASGLKGRQRKSFNERQAIHLVAEYTDSFHPLRELEAFRCFEDLLMIRMEELGYLSTSRE